MFDKLVPEKMGLGTNFADLVREFETAEYNIPAPGGPKIPRPYQIAGAEAIVAHFRAGRRVALLDHSTGAGKSLTAKLAIDKLGLTGRVLYVAHRDFLLRQFRSEWDTGAPVYMDDASRDDMVHMATISKLVSLSRTDPDAFRRRLEMYKMIVVDEVQHYPATDTGEPDADAAKTWAGVIAMFRERESLVLGLTGTAFRSDGLPPVIDDFKKHIVHNYSTQEGVNDGFLSQVMAKSVRTHVVPTSEHWHGDRLVCNFSNLRTAKRTKVILKTIRDENKNRGRTQQGIVFLQRVCHAEEFCRAANASRGVGRAEAVSHNMSAQQQSEVFARFKTGETNLIVNVNVATEGADLPNCDLVCMAAATRSMVRYIQQLGRGLRLHNGKDYLLVIDFVDNYKKARHVIDTVNASWLTRKKGIWNSCPVFRQGGCPDEFEYIGYSIKDIENLLESNQATERSGRMSPANRLPMPWTGAASDILSKLGERVYIAVEGELTAMNAFLQDYESETGKPLALGKWATVVGLGKKAPRGVQIRVMFDQPDPSMRTSIMDTVKAYRKRKSKKKPVKETGKCQIPTSERGDRPFIWRFSSVEIGWMLFKAGLKPGENIIGQRESRVTDAGKLVINGDGTLTMNIGGVAIKMQMSDVISAMGPAGLEINGTAGATILVPLNATDRKWITSSAVGGRAKIDLVMEKLSGKPRGVKMVREPAEKCEESVSDMSKK